MAKVTFVGAVGTVTGSCTWMKWNGRQILVDCGFFQGGDEIERRNWQPFPFEPSEIDAVVVTHSHLDHIGLLPRLVAAGFSGPIYCTRATRPLAGLILDDSAQIQEEQARYARRKGYSRHADPKPLYAPADARRARELIQAIAFDKDHELFPGINVRFRRAGHLLGAAHLMLTAKDAQGEKRRWCFSGDIGRWDVPILIDPEPPFDADEAPADALVLESTYGDRLHVPEDPEAALAEIIQRTFARGGVVIIPSFALGRAQDVLYHLAALARDGVLSTDQVFLDSPMAIDATTFYQQFAAEHDEDFQKLRLARQGPLDPDAFRRARSADESKALNRMQGPLVIVASSGMAAGGRVVHHLKQRLPDARNSVVFVGYQAGGTRGRAMVDGADTVAIHGQSIPVVAEVTQISGLSAHGDRAELLRWCTSFPVPPKRVFLNHGEDPARKALACALEEMGWPRPELPLPGDAFDW